MHGNIRIGRQEWFDLFWQGQWCSRGNRTDYFGGHDHDQFGIRLCPIDGLKELAQNRYVADERHLLEGFGFAVVEQSTNGEALSLVQFDLSLYPSDRDGGHR